MSPFCSECLEWLDCLPVAVLGTDPRTSCTLGKCWLPELHSGREQVLSPWQHMLEFNHHCVLWLSIRKGALGVAGIR